MNDKTVRFVDLFSGMGGIRLGFQQAFQEAGYKTECVLTSEIKPAAVTALQRNFPGEKISGDISQVKAEDIPDFDFMLAGFPCQAFSSAGKQRGFADTRGTLFFEVERIIKAKKPYGFILENVEGLVIHDKINPTDHIGRTLKTILHSLRKLGYKVSWKVLDSQNFGLAQARNRIYIVGTREDKISLVNFEKTFATFGDVMEKGMDTDDCEFCRKLFENYSVEELYGKSIKDKRGGPNNIHSWDLGLRGDVSEREKQLLNMIMLERRKRHWSDEIGIEWMDGMPLTESQIATFWKDVDLPDMLKRLTEMGYLVFEHPKKKVLITVPGGTAKVFDRVYDETKPKGYNIVSGKLSFRYSKILCPNSTTPTLVAMDISTVGVIDNSSLRSLTLREGLRLFGYPPNYSLEDFTANPKAIKMGFDLLGNTVCVPVIKAICERLAASYTNHLGGVENG